MHTTLVGWVFSYKHTTYIHIHTHIHVQKYTHVKLHTYINTHNVLGVKQYGSSPYCILPSSVLQYIAKLQYSYD